MPAGPDIVVTQPDSPEVQVAVEVKVGVSARDAEGQIREYMVRQNCPIGMLVTPEWTVFFRNPYTGYDAQTIRKTGECQTRELLGTTPEGVTEERLLQLVEQWLERLRLRRGKVWPPSVQEAIESHVLPALMGGTVRATGPRWRRTGTSD
jgi:hypothetical protein